MLECEKEPIHIPGAVQPFGLLFSLEWPTLNIQNVSVNCMEGFGMEASALVGRSFVEFVEPADMRDLWAYFEQANLQEQSPIELTMLSRAPVSKRTWLLSANKHNGCLIVELEKTSVQVIDYLHFHKKIRNAVQILQLTTSVDQLCDAAVQQVRQITGFDRVMVYQFTEEWHGKVIAESCAPHMQSYYGHYFPASDIPAQARAVFLQNWLRMIPDVDYVPVKVFPAINPQNGMPLDLGHSMLRSVSPIHIEYLQNMQVKSTMTISLISDGRLWGLIACHHATPRMIDMDCRLATKMIGQIVSSQLQLKQSLDDTAYRGQLRATHSQLLSYMEQEPDLAQGLVKYSPSMLDLANATGAAAAIYHDNKWTVIGNTPSIAQIEELVDWLSTIHQREGIYATNHLSKQFPPAQAYKEIASGLMAVAIPKSARNYMLWFRPEVITTVVWAGKPEKAVQSEGDAIRLHPRASFASWREIVEGVAEPWRKVELEAIQHLRNSILALDLQREFIKEQEARAQAERVSREKEHMIHVVSHDLRTPLGVVSMTLEMLKLGRKENLSDRERLLFGRAFKATDAISRLINDVLDIAKADAGQRKFAARTESARQLVTDAIEMVTQQAQNRAIALHVDVQAENDAVACERSRIDQVLNNLIGNALKFTPARGSIAVSVLERDDKMLFRIADTGIGIAPENIGKVFDRFWQGTSGQEQGAGLGISIVKRIIEEHGGEIWVESNLGEDSQFYFTLHKAIG
jgi:light-regulated signal transduction histidine kinase (bacteriophytochrome)